MGLNWFELFLNPLSLKKGPTAPYHFFHVPIHEPVQLVQGQFDPMVGHSALGEIVGSDLFRSVSRPHLTPSFGCDLVILLLLHEFE